MLIKPDHLRIGDTIATISPSWGCAGSSRVKWKYMSGVERLRGLGLHVIAAPNSMRGTAYLRNNPEARAEDILWAFENRNVKAVIANIGGNDSYKVIPFLDKNIIASNPKILCGYSDVMSLHIFCLNAGLTTFYGPNLLTGIAEQGRWHPYSKYWFQRTFFDTQPAYNILPSCDFSGDIDNHVDPEYRKSYITNDGYKLIQGTSIVHGRLFGGHTGLMDVPSDMLSTELFKDTIFFFEDIPEFMRPEWTENFWSWMGENGYLQTLSGIVIGKLRSSVSFEPAAERMMTVLARYGRCDLPVLYGLNFGHTSPGFILPYGCMAEISPTDEGFRILESGVL